VTFPPEYDPTGQAAGGAQPGPMGNQPYPPPGQDQQYGAPGQQYGQPGQPYTGMPGQPFGQPGQPYTGMPGQPFGQPGQPYGTGPGSQPGYMGQPGGVPYPPPGASSNMANVARGRGIRQIVIGAVIFVIGLIITIATYSAASSSHTGGTYFVAYGPMIIGVISMIRGGIAVAQAQKLR
jgi:hypothetical protein